MASLHTRLRNYDFAVISIGLFLVSLILTYAMLENQESMTPGITLDSVFSLLNILISIIMCAVSSASSFASFNLSLFWTFNYIFLGMTPLTLSFDSSPYYLANLASKETILKANILIFLALFVSAVTQILLIKSFRSKFPKVNLINYQKIYDNAKIVFYIYVIILFPVVSYLGGFSQIFRTTRFNNFSPTVNLPIYSIAYAIIYGIPSINATCFMLLSKVNHIKVSKKYIFITTTWCLLLSNPFGIARQTTLLMIMPILSIYAARIRVLRNALLVSLPLIISFGSGIIDRYTGQFKFQALRPFSQNGDFDAFFQFANGIQVFDSVEFRPFRQLIGSLLFFVPRSIWEDKPLDTGVEVAKNFGLRFENLSAPWILENYANARYLGIVLGAILMIITLFYTQIGGLQDFRGTLYACTISGLIFIVLRGSLLQATGMTVTCILTAILHNFGSKKR